MLSAWDHWFEPDLREMGTCLSVNENQLKTFFVRIQQRKPVIVQFSEPLVRDYSPIT